MIPFVTQHLSSTYSLEKTVHGKKKKKQDVEEHETVITLSSDKMLIKKKYPQNKN